MTFGRGSECVKIERPIQQLPIRAYGGQGGATSDPSDPDQREISIETAERFFKALSAILSRKYNANVSVKGGKNGTNHEGFDVRNFGSNYYDRDNRIGFGG